jgi:ASPIC and UnbV
VQWADFDRDGDEDLALTGSRPDGMHSLLRNQLTTASARQSLQVRVVDGRGRATLAGAEVRVYEADTRKLLGARLVDSGSGYDAQNEMPVHFGLVGHARVDVEVIYPSRQQRKVGRRPGVRIPVDRLELLTIKVDR